MVPTKQIFKYSQNWIKHSAVIPLTQTTQIYVWTCGFSILFQFISLIFIDAYLIKILHKNIQLSKFQKNWWWTFSSLIFSVSSFYSLIWMRKNEHLSYAPIKIGVTHTLFVIPKYYCCRLIRLELREAKDIHLFLISILDRWTCQCWKSYCPIIACHVPWPARPTPLCWNSISISSPLHLFQKQTP